jgi:hypothetical protein
VPLQSVRRTEYGINRVRICSDEQLWRQWLACTLAIVEACITAIVIAWVSH